MTRINKRYLKAYGSLYGNERIEPRKGTVLKRSYNNKQICPTERQEHLLLMKWFRDHPLLSPLVIHIANEYDGGGLKGMMRKALGVRAGVSDFFVPFPCSDKHGLWIELKRKKGSKVTPEQLDWLAKMRNLGYAGHIAYGCVHAIKLIEDYLKG